MTHDELRTIATDLLNLEYAWWPTELADAGREMATAWLKDNPRDNAELVSAAAMRQEPGWTQATDANCFWRGGVLGTLRMWPNTGCVEFGNYVLVRAGATLGDIRKLAAVLCREGRA